MSKKIGIIGAGIAGLSCAVMLERLGHEVTIFEAAEQIRGIGAGMGLASNAIKAFEYLGLDEDVKGISFLLPGFEITDRKRKPILSINTQKIQESYQAGNYTVHRADLHRLLLSKLEKTNIKTGKRLVQIAEYKQHIAAVFEDQSKEVFDYLIGADGVNSMLRQLLMPGTSPRYAGYWCWRNVVEMPDENWDKAVEIWSPEGRYGVTPLTKNRFYWFACINSDQKDGVNHFRMKELKECFSRFDPEMRKVLELSKDENLISTPIVDIEPISKYNFRKALLIGDAAHATTPNMGQGACMAVEDVAVLKDELMKNEDFETAFSNFEKRRLGRTHYIIEKSLLAGKIAQMDSPIKVFFRNTFFRMLPGAITQKPLNRLLTEDFMKA